MAVSRHDLVRCAKNMVRTCNVKAGEGVVVKGGVHALELLEEISLECYKRGATPTIVISSDRYVSRVYKDVPEKTLEQPPKQYVGMVKATDLIISVEELDDPRIAERFPRNKLKARQKAMVPIYDIVYHATEGKKWLYAGWPTRSAAKSYGIPYKQLESIIVGGISVPSKRLMASGQKLNRKFADSRWAHVWDSNGTDFRVNVEGRRTNVDDGFISDQDFDVGDRGANLPAGELFIAPHETEGEGTIFCPITRDRLSDKIVTDVHIEFEDGMLQLDRVDAGKNLSALVSSFKGCEEVDRTTYNPVRTRNIAELGIGFNPKITKAIGYILTDEKVTGTVHVAFGSNNTYGGTSESTMHWDFVTAPGVNVDVERTDGSTVQVMRRGRFV